MKRKKNDTTDVHAEYITNHAHKMKTWKGEVRKSLEVVPGGEPVEFDTPKNSAGRRKNSSHKNKKKGNAQSRLRRGRIRLEEGEGVHFKVRRQPPGIRHEAYAAYHTRDVVLKPKVRCISEELSSNNLHLVTDVKSSDFFSLYMSQTERKSKNICPIGISTHFEISGVIRSTVYLQYTHRTPCCWPPSFYEWKKVPLMH